MFIGLAEKGDPPPPKREQMFPRLTPRAEIVGADGYADIVIAQCGRNDPCIARQESATTTDRLQEDAMRPGAGGLDLCGRSLGAPGRAPAPGGG